MLFQWTDLLSIGIREIDEQHKRLVRLFNELGEVMKYGKGEERIRKTLTDLLDYTRYHFSAEEDFMRRNGYPHLEQHRAQHEELTRKVREYQEKYSNQEYVVTEVMRLLRGWLFSHIAETDLQIADFLRDRGAH